MHFFHFDIRSSQLLVTSLAAAILLHSNILWSRFFVAMQPVLRLLNVHPQPPGIPHFATWPALGLRFFSP